MPIPVFLIEFRIERGRDPVSDELSLPQRHELYQCAIENQRNGCWSAQEVEDFFALSGLREVKKP